MTKKSLSDDPVLGNLPEGSCFGHWSGSATECKVCFFEPNCKVDTRAKSAEKNALAEENPKTVITPFDQFVKHLEFKCELVETQELEGKTFYQYSPKNGSEGYVKITVLKTKKMKIVWGTSEGDEESKVCEPLNAFNDAERLASMLVAKFEHE